LELLRGTDLESTSRDYGVTTATLSQRRDAFLAAGAEGLKIRQEDLVDERCRRPLCLRPPAQRGPKTRYSDDDLLAEIRRTIQELPFHGEGHRKVWARFRVREVRTSMRRVLRLMRENDLLALQR